MEKLTEEELETVKKFYRLYLDDIPENKNDVCEFVDSLSSYDKEKHYNDEELESTVSEIVDKYFKKNGMLVRPFGRDESSFTITNEGIEKRKKEVSDWIKSARDKERCNGHTYRHYDGGACCCSEELHSFYWYVFDRYYESIGASWEYK
jgi:hypothetical protein